MKGAGGGEIVQVQGGHILRSTGRKDRHSKVYTAKGPRDRRVRLSAHTAIQFYDVQDRLGYDRPSKAVDWLIKKAKNAIDKLDELPPWNPNDNSNEVPSSAETKNQAEARELALEQHSESSSRYEFQLPRQIGENPSNNSPYIANPADAESLGDTMKSFFPMNSGISLMSLQSYSHDIMSRASVQSEDLGLSLHTLQDSNPDHRSSTDQVLFPSSGPLTFEASVPRMAGWNCGGTGENKVGFIFNSQSMLQQPLLCQNSPFPQREPLQSNYSHLMHAWGERSLSSTDQSAILSSHFSSEFQVPARIHGGGAHGVAFIKPPTSSPNSHH